ncbi:MAG: SIMPL domain-containing protein [Dehalococcoidia bacterium]|nr:MAG: SIMPL domain-containing protein [Dehalococcoidia bacterium]
MKKGLLLVFLLMLTLVVGAAGCSSYFGSDEGEVVGTISSQQNIGIWVTGVGKSPVVPDIAVLSMGVQTQKDTVVEAQQTALEAMNGLMAVFDEYNISEEDIQTQQFSIQPVYRWDEGEQILLGYGVTNIVTVKIRDIVNTGGIIDAAVAAGGDYTRINSISFDVDEPEAYYESARKAAMEDANLKAEQLAELGEVKLGKPSYISEYTNYAPPPIIYRDFEESIFAGETAISPGEIEIHITLEIHYSIK